MLRVLIDGTPEFRATVEHLANRGDDDLAAVEPAVREILAAVRAEGDEAVLRFGERFDGRRADPLLYSASMVEERGRSALGRLSPATCSALELAAARIRAFHVRQRDDGVRYEDGGVSLGTRVLPLRRAGIYAPGGKARYPSSILMSAIPASVAGVGEIILATPLSGADDAIFAAAVLSGVTALVDAGGAQAIAALAWGTRSVPRVDKIVGPGNLYVACAKRLVYGAVAIDGIAGPSEILVIADDDACARVIAADLLSQAEHDEAAYPLLLCASEAMASSVAGELTAQLASLPRANIARAALARNGHAFVAPVSRMGEIADLLSVEHVALHVVEPEAMLGRVRRAGAAFLGSSTPEAAGDYLAGPSHVLPTGGAVRFGSPLGVYDFVTRTSLIRYSPDALARQAEAICALARLEGLEAHARAVEARLSRLE